MKIVAIVVVFAVSTAPTQARGCGLDILGICRAADRIADSLDHLPDEVREAAEEVLDHFFNDVLPGTIDKLTAAAKQLADRAEKDFEQAVNATRAQLEQLATTVVRLVEELAKDITKDVEQIVDVVERDTLSLVQNIISDVDSRVNSLLTRLENDGKELFCAAQGYLDIMQKQFASFFERQDCECVQETLRINPGLQQDCKCTSCFHLGGFYPSCRCNPWGLRFGPGWYNQGKYNFLKCHLEKAIDWERWTVDQVVKQLSIVQEAALSFRCLEDLNPGSTGNRDYFTNEYTNVTHTILVWTQDPMSARSSAPVVDKTTATATSSAGRGGAKEPAAPSAIGNNDCQGLQLKDCVTQVMEKLKSMEVDFKQESADVKQAVAATDARLNSLQNNVTAQIVAVGAGMQDQKDKTATMDISSTLRSDQIPRSEANGFICWKVNDLIAIFCSERRDSGTKITMKK